VFTHLLPSDGEIFKVSFSEYAERHFLKRFAKAYKGKRWQATFESITQDMARLKKRKNDLQKTAQVDELWHKGDFWIFKYDFRIAQTKESPKSSGNRCLAFLDNAKNEVKILLIYGKGDLPKNRGEQAFIEQILSEEFQELFSLVK
jgi:hypothetical protein